MSKDKPKDYYVYSHSLAEQPPFYIGKGDEKRIKEIHRKNNPHHCNIVNKYGKENIIVRSILCRNEKHAFELEVKLIAALRNGGVKLANMTDGGDGVSGYVHTDEARAKMSEAKIGTPRSDETKAKIGNANRGRVVSEETRVKIGAAGKGMKHTEETKAKISESSKGRTHTEESKAKISASGKGKGKGVPKSEEHKSKISEAVKLRYLKNKESATEELSGQSDNSLKQPVMPLN